MMICKSNKFGYHLFPIKLRFVQFSKVTIFSKEKKSRDVFCIFDIVNFDNVWRLLRIYLEVQRVCQ